MRSTDFVGGHDGKVMHGLALVYVIRDLHGVLRYRSGQESLALTRVLLATDHQFDEANTDRIMLGIQQRLGPGVSVEIERMDEVPKENSGKYRYVISHVTPSPEAENGRRNTA